MIHENDGNEPMDEQMDEPRDEVGKPLSVWIMVGVILFILALAAFNEEYNPSKKIQPGRLAFMFSAYVLITFALTVPALRTAWNAVISRVFECRKITYYQSLALVTVIYVFLLLHGFPDT